MTTLYETDPYGVALKDEATGIEPLAPNAYGGVMRVQRNPNGVRAVVVDHDEVPGALAELTMVQHLSEMHRSAGFRVGYGEGRTLTSYENAVLGRALDHYLKSRFAIVAGDTK
jgi:hypothetical protein